MKLDIDTLREIWAEFMYEGKLDPRIQPPVADNDPFDFIGNTELRVDTGASSTPHVLETTGTTFGVIDGDNIGVGAALAVVAVYVAFGLVALAVDRRALLVSALAYVLIALTFLFREFGAVELNFALTALVIGSALLTLSALWTPIRRAVVNGLPGDVQTRLPATA